MDSEKIIHIQLEYPEAISVKKDILLTEAGILKIHGNLKEYHNLRREELKTKRKINTKIRKVNSNLKKLGVLMPDVEKPKILKKSKEKNEEEDIIEDTIKIKHYKNNIEKDLEDVQRRLRMLDEKF